MFLFKNSGSQNLIQNPSFESYTNTLNCLGGFDNYNATPVYHVLDNWYSYNSPDYFNSSCGTNGFTVPNSWFGENNAKNGIAFSGIGAYDIRNNYKEYIYQQLSSPLQAGKIYCLSFFVSRADRFPFAVKNMGAYFSNSLPSLIGGEYISAIPQVENQSTFLTDTIGWVEVQGCFTALGGEQYITFGNFHDNSTTDTLRIQSTNPLTGTGTDVSYYYIDDITLIDQSTVGVNELSNGTSVSVYPNPANDVLNINIGSLKENTKIKIYNALGELVLTESLITQNSLLKTHHLQSGIYFYSILVGEKTIKTDKIVIIK